MSAADYQSAQSSFHDMYPSYYDIYPSYYNIYPKRSKNETPTWVVAGTVVATLALVGGIEVVLFLSNKTHDFPLGYVGTAKVQWLSGLTPTLAIGPLVWLWKRRNKDFITLQPPVAAKPSVLTDLEHKNSFKVLGRVLNKGQLFIIVSSLTVVTVVLLHPLAEHVFLAKSGVTGGPFDVSVQGTATWGLNPTYTDPTSFVAAAGYAEAKAMNNVTDPIYRACEQQEEQSILHESLAYRFPVMTIEPNMGLRAQLKATLLPLIAFLGIIIFSRNFLSFSFLATERMYVWKQRAYYRSTRVFKDFLFLLTNLPRYFNFQIYVKEPKLNRHDAVHMHGSADVLVRARRSTASLAIRPSWPSQSQVSVNLPGKTVHFINTDMESPASPQRSAHTKFNLDNIPDLTGSITIVKGPLRAGGFCDIFSGVLTSARGTELVAMKMLRVFNTEAHVVRAKKVSARPNPLFGVSTKELPRNSDGKFSVWRSLRHHHVLPFYGTCELDEFRLFMVSPWAEGGNSLEYLRRNPSANRGQLLWQTSSALEYLHSGRDAQQIVHGNLKADNVLISAAGDALLCDFGLSRYVEEIISMSGSSSAGRAGGHARFMAPELLMPPKDAPTTKPTTETDVYAFASLMLQIYTEELPFADLPEAAAIIKLAHGELPPRPVEPIVLERGCDEQIWALMLDCWNFRPAKRPNMEEVSHRITAVGL